MLERDIELEWVTRVLAYPQKVEPDQSDPTKFHAFGAIPEKDDRVLHVIYNGTTEPWLVISVYFDRKMRGKL